MLNPLSKYVTKMVDLNKPVDQSGVPTYGTTKINGYVITLQTPKGTLAYKITRAFLVPKEQAGNVASIMAEKTPNRVTLITCAVGHGEDLDYNVIVDAYLASSVAAKA